MQFKEKCLLLFVVDNIMYIVVMKTMYYAWYLVSSPCMVPLASLKKEKYLRLFVVVVVMETV